MKSISQIRHSLLNRRSERGSMLFISVFVIVVMGMLGLTLTNMLATSAQSVVYESLGLKALNAARTGLEVNLSRTFPLSTSAALPCQVSESLSNVPGLEGCSYTANCQLDNSSSLINYYRFTSTGQCSVSDVVVSRTVAVDARSL